MESRLKVMRKRRGRSLHRKIVEYSDLFNLNITLIAQDKTSGDYEVFQPEPDENWPPAMRDIGRREKDMGESLRSELQRLEKLVKQSKVPKPPKP
ncbi:hypothetical protein DL767_010442 [Monosporascus sp. MG133]|nr:hypothetical protein DL767_010442 [Monosporascus sp. MG133]